MRVNRLFGLIPILLVFLTSIVGSEPPPTDEIYGLRQSILLQLRRGSAPDTSLLRNLLSGTEQVTDSLLAASVFLAVGDTSRAVSFLDFSAIENLPAWEILAEQRLLVKATLGETVTGSFLELWRLFPDTAVGRRSLLAAMESSGMDNVALIDESEPMIHTWSGPETGRWHFAAGNILAQSGSAEEALPHWWRTIVQARYKWKSAAAESLAVHVNHEWLSWKRRKSLASALIEAGLSDRALLFLPVSGAPDDALLLRAKALLGAGRTREGEVLLQRLARGPAWVSAQAYWELALREKRSDSDRKAAAYYLTLAEKHPGNWLAGKAVWEGAWALERQGLFTEAGEAYRKLKVRWPQSKRGDTALLRWGLTAWREQSIEEAARRWRKGVSEARTGKGKAALGYWLGKAKLLLGEFDDAKRWWAWSAVTDSTSYYGLLASRRLTAERFIGLRSPRIEGTLPRVGIPSLWVLSWAKEDEQIKPNYDLERAIILYKCGLMTRAGEELKNALDGAGSSPLLLAEILSEAISQENYRISSTTAGRLIALFASETDGHPPLWLRRLRYPMPYPDIIKNMASLWNLDPGLIAGLIRKESYYSRQVVSRAGAVGLMQLMPQTAVEVAKTLGLPEVGSLSDAANNMTLGCAYLRSLLDDSNGHNVFALASYNAGPHNTERWIDALGDDDQELWIETITYGETRDYIKSVLSFALRYRSLWSE